MPIGPHPDQEQDDRGEQPLQEWAEQEDDQAEQEDAERCAGPLPVCI